MAKMAQFVLVRDVKSQKVRKVNPISPIPEGVEVIGAYFGHLSAIAVYEDARLWFLKAGVGGWTSGPTRFVLGKNGEYRISKLFDYIPKEGESVLGAIWGIDVLGKVLTFDTFEGATFDLKLILALIKNGSLELPK